MTVKFVQWFPFNNCKHPFLASLSNPDSLPQRQQLNTFIQSNNISDYSFTKDNTVHDMTGLIIQESYCSLDTLVQDIVAASSRARQYFYLAVNKFFIFSTVDVVTNDADDYDTKLVRYCHQAIADNFTLINYTVRPDDDGSLGNFVHPVTTMFFKRNA